MDPLDGVDEVPWRELHHAYGSAEDVPGLLRRLLGDQAEREAAQDALHGNIWHQGTTYEATAFAVPFLARLAEAELALAPELLFDLGAIADGTPHPDASDSTARTAVEAELTSMVALVRAHMTRPVIAGFCRLAYAFPSNELVRSALDEAFQADAVTPLDQAAVVMALLRGGCDESWGDVVLLDVLVEAVRST